MTKYEGYLIDLDGTTYRGKERIPEAEVFIRNLLKNEFPFKLVTNNATKTVDEIVHNLNTYYEIPIDESHVYTSIIALGDYIELNHPGANVYVLGESALMNQVIDRGFTVDSNKKVDVVVQGLKRDVTYDELTVAVQAILSGAEYVVTNTDRLIPTETGLNPSSGAITSFIQFATRKKPIIIGKPNKPIMEGALAQLGISKDKVLMIGDNYDTDIMAGMNMGMDTLLVLTGITIRDDLKVIPEQPTYIVESLSEWER
ncbi:TIGR01457 family HAD-type hydrolase [Aerococcaceae bacterium DSM 111021]|nr:TIGR01457 family HAD-type hydrolase [Aerococcaceae bacterium DSM 111021]